MKELSRNIPFGNTYGYSAFGHQISNTMKHYSSGTSTRTDVYQNNRFSGSSYWDNGYDNDGNQIKDADNSYKTYKYDAAGKMAGSYFIDFDAEPVEEQHETMSYDGDGMLVKIHTLLEPDGGSAQNTYSYQLRSSVLKGEVITEANGDGSRARTYIRANGTVVAWDNGTLYYSHKDPAMHTIRTTNASGNVQDFGGGTSDDRDKQELDADGRSLDFTDLYIGGGSPDLGPDMFAQGNSFGLNAGGHNTTYAVNGVSVPHSYIQAKIDSGLMGGIFGLLEYTSWMSTQKRKIGEIWRETVATPRTDGNGDDDNPFRVGSIDRHKRADVYEYADTSWSVVWLFFFEPPQEDLVKNAIKNARDYLENNKYCRDFLNKVIQNITPNGDELGYFTFGDEKDEAGRRSFRIINADDLLKLALQAKVTESGKSGITTEGSSTVWTNDLKARPGEIIVNKPFATRKPEEKMFGAIHEAFHQLKGVDDLEIARAAQLANGNKDPKKFKNTDEGRRDASAEFNRLVLLHCKGLSTDSSRTFRF